MDEHRIFLVVMGVTATLISLLSGFIDGFPLSDMTVKNGIAVLLVIYLLLILIDRDYVKNISKK